MEILKKIINEHLEYRKQILKLAKVGFKRENSNSLLGGLWNIVRPIIIILVYWFTFSIGLRSGGDVNEQPFLLWLLVGIIPWFYISEMLVKGGKALISNKHLITKMKFPLSIIATFTNITHFFTHLMLVGVIFIMYFIFKVPLTIYVLQLPIYIILTFTFLNLWSFFISILVVFSKDLLQLIKSLITALFWLSGIIFNINNIDIPLIKLILDINPITFLVTGYRNCFLNQVWFFEQPKQLLVFLIILVILALLGLQSFRKLRKEIPDVL